MKPPHDLDRFTAAYADAALTESLGDDGIPLRLHGLEGLAPETVRQMRVDCAQFRLEAGDAADDYAVVDVARDFWLERNQPTLGAFYVGDYPGPSALHLTRLAQRFGPTELYLDDDDGLIHAR
jgi:hypothetical protein